MSLFLLTMNLCLSDVTIHSLSHNFPIDMILVWELGNIFACFSWLDKCFSVIWDWCVDSIVDKFGSFTLIGFPDVSLVWTTVFRAYR